jgi:hypothetical protein
MGFFHVCTMDGPFFALDAHIRRRLRAIMLWHWKTKRSIVRRLVSLGRSLKEARQVYKRRSSWWAMSLLPSVNHALKSSYFAAQGLLSLKEEWKRWKRSPVIAPTQLEFAWAD